MPLSEKNHKRASEILASGSVMSTKTPNLYGKPGGPSRTVNNDLSESEFNKRFKGGVFAGKYQTIVDAAHKHDMPASLVASIMGFETGWGKSDKSKAPYNNPAGIMAGGAGNREHKKFETLDEGIDAAVEVQKRIHTQGGETIPGMAAIYAPVKPDGSPVANDPKGTNKQWPGTVAKLQKQLQEYSGPEEGAGKGLRLDPVQMAAQKAPDFVQGPPGHYPPGLEHYRMDPDWPGRKPSPGTIENIEDETEAQAVARKALDLKKAWWGTVRPEARMMEGPSFGVNWKKDIDEALRRANKLPPDFKEPEEIEWHEKHGKAVYIAPDLPPREKPSSEPSDSAQRAPPQQDPASPEVGLEKKQPRGGVVSVGGPSVAPSEDPRTNQLVQAYNERERKRLEGLKQFGITDVKGQALPITSGSVDPMSELGLRTSKVGTFEERIEQMKERGDTEKDIEKERKRLRHLEGITFLKDPAEIFYDVKREPGTVPGTLAHEGGHAGRELLRRTGEHDPTIRGYGVARNYPWADPRKEEITQRMQDIETSKTLEESGVSTPLEQKFNREAAESFIAREGKFSPEEKEEVLRHTKMYQDYARRMLQQPTARQDGGSAVDLPLPGPSKFKTGSELDSATPKVNGNGKLDVDVKAPTGVTVKAEGEGVFNKTETNRTNINQLEPVL